MKIGGCALVFWLALVCAARANEVGYVETFALADDRAKVLEQLVPGTEEYYHYHCLHYQHTGQFQKADEIIKAWTKRHGFTAAAEEMINRQALLQYPTNPQGALNRIKRQLNLQFNHQKRELDREIKLPTTLDPALISHDRLAGRAFAFRDDTGRFEDAAFDFLVRSTLTPRQRRHLLSRLTRPDYPGLVALIVDDLKFEYSGGFGQHGIHRQLLPEQLEECLRLMPELIHNTNFILTYLSKLQPGADVEWQSDPGETGAYLDRLLAFVRRLAPSQNSLKAHALFHRLAFERKSGNYPKDLFMEYLLLPRNVAYINPRYAGRAEFNGCRAELQANYSAQTLLPPVGNDEPLVRDFLARFLKDARDSQAFAEYIESDYLKDVFAETKMLNGVGDMEQWYALVSPERAQSLKDRVDIELLPTNRELVDAEDAVTLDVAVKNVPSLIVKTYEINTRNFFRQNLRDLSTAIDLDGLVANVERTMAFDTPPIRRHAERIGLPHIAKPGVYVVELIGNGISSRALIRKGRLTFTERVGSAGHAFTVYDGKGARMKDATLWLNGQEYRADADGEIAVPFSGQPARRTFVLSAGGFSSLGSFDHQAEAYALSAGFYAESESLVEGETCRVLVRPELTVNGARVDVGLLQETALTVQTVDREGAASVLRVGDFKLHNDQESVHEFRVPENTAAIAFTLSGRVQSLGLGTKVDLSAVRSVALNAIERSERTEDIHLRHSGGRYLIQVLGKTGEPRAERPVNVTLKHRAFVDTVDVTLKTDAAGAADLGELKDIVSVAASCPGLPGRSWRTAAAACSRPSLIHGLVGEPLMVALPAGDDAREGISLLETRGGTFVRDCRDSVAIRDGLLRVDDLPAGDYDLFVKREGRGVTLRITAGKEDNRYFLSRHRALEKQAILPLQIASLSATNDSLVVELANATPSTRVHIAVTRFIGDTTIFSELGAPSLLQPAGIRFGWPQSLFLSGRNIGDEYRYILERKYAAKFPGNLLKRPSLLLNPWSLRKTDTGEQAALEGEVHRGIYGGRSPGSRGRALQAFGGGGAGGEGGGTADACYDFLSGASVVLANLRPDRRGRIAVPRSSLGGGQQVHVLAVNRETAAYRETSLAPKDDAFRDRRLARMLNPERHFAEQKRLSAVRPQATFRVDDITTSKVEVYDSLARAYGLLTALSNDDTLREFGFILTWPDLKPDAKQDLYSKYACHELSFFLFHKDPEFFGAVIRPYLANKKDKTFMDRWLLREDLSAFLKPWAYGRLNTVERILLGQRIAGEAAHAARHVADLHDLIAPDRERFNRQFATALKGSALDLGDAYGYDKAKGAALQEGTALAADGRTLKLAEDLPAGPAGKDLARPAKRPMTPPPASAPAPTLERSAPGEPASARREERDDARGSRLRARDELAKEMDDAEIEVTLEKDAKQRESVRSLYRPLDRTEEWVENNYYRLPIEQQVASLVTPNGFWRDYAAHDGKAGFLSPRLPEASGSFAEMMLALAVLDLPFKSGRHAVNYTAARMDLTPSNNVIVAHKEIREVPAGDKAQVLLVSQNFFARDDRYRHEGGEQYDKFVTEEFLVARAYGCQVVLTNPTSTRRKVEILLQIPEGAMPVLNGFQTRSLSLQLEPYSTQTQEYSFYFPHPGRFRHYPVHIAQDEALLGYAPAFTFEVKEKLTRIDRESWDYISQHGSAEEVLAYLRTHNADRLDLDLIAFRAREPDFLDSVLALLSGRHVYSHTLWSYGVLHNRAAAIREYLPHTPFAAQCGPCLESPLLTLDPVARHAYQHREYWPLVNARVAQLGRTRRIMNREFFEQYGQFLRNLAYRPALNDDDRMSACLYLLLQDRVGEAMAFFDKPAAPEAPASLQRDYARAYLAFSRGDAAAARKTAEKYRDYPVPRWRNLFRDVLAQAEEIEGKSARVVDAENRDQRQVRLADTDPSLEMKVEDRTVSIRYANLDACTVNFYLMDVELLFSRQPFVQDVGGQFSVIQPNETVRVTLPAGERSASVPLPPALRDRNVLVEVTAGGITRVQACYPNALTVQVVENYGQVRVTHERTGKPVPGAYVKVYARTRGGAARFYKDGYTDLRGRFDYTSLSTGEVGAVERFSILILSDTFGAVVREAAPPAM